MDAKLENGRVSFHLFELFELIPAEMKPELIETLSCDEEIIRHVTRQILDKWTENLYSGSGACSAQPTPYCALDVARREIALRSGEVAKGEIEALTKSLASTEKEKQKYMDLYFELKRKVEF